MIRCLELDSTLSKQRTDREIQLAILLERRLQCLMQLDVRIHICGEKLQMFGVVASWYQKQMAQEMARELAPELQIRNELRVS